MSTDHRPDRYLDALPVLQPGDRVLVDGKTEAEVVRQTPRRMFTHLLSDGMHWHVMTDRLTQVPEVGAVFQPGDKVVFKTPERHLEGIVLRQSRKRRYTRLEDDNGLHWWAQTCHLTKLPDESPTPTNIQ